jgi:hypothetical protein
VSWEEIIRKAKARGFFTIEEQEASLGCFDCSCTNDNPTRIFRNDPNGPQDTWLYCWKIDFYLAVRHNNYTGALEILAKIISRRLLISPYIEDMLLLLEDEDEDEVLPL